MPPAPSRISFVAGLRCLRRAGWSVVSVLTPSRAAIAAGLSAALLLACASTRTPGPRESDGAASSEGPMTTAPATAPAAGTAPAPGPGPTTTSDGADRDTTGGGSATGEAATPVVVRVAPFVAAVHGMAVDDQRRLLFSDSFGQLDPTRRVYRLDPPYDGEPEPTPLTGSLPAGLEFIDGDLYLCDVNANEVVQYDAAFAPVRRWTVGAPWNVIAGPGDDRIVVTFDGQVVRLAASGATEARWAGLDAPFDLAGAEGGTLWISEQGAKPGDPGRLAAWTPQGRMAVSTRYPWANPEGLAFGPDGALWVAETERQELLRVTPDGAVERVAEVDGLPVVIAPLPSGDLLVSVTGADPHLLRVRFGRP